MATTQTKPVAEVYGVSVAALGAELARVAATYPEAVIEFIQSGTAVLHRVPSPAECKAGFAERNQHCVWVIAGTHFGWAVERNPDGTESDRGQWYGRYHV